MWLGMMLLGASSGTAWALDATQIPAKNLRVAWEEPTTNADGSALDDLDHILIRGSLDGVAFADVVAPASGPTGGQAGSYTFVDACPPNSRPMADLKLYAVDTTGNLSEDAPLTVTMDCLPPGKVQ